MKHLHVKKDDLVVVLSGDDKGKKGKVIAVSPEEGKVMVEKVNMVKKHYKARKQGEVSSIQELEGAIYADKVQLVCQNSKCARYNCGVRVRYEVTVDAEGKTTKTRKCAKCGAEI